MAAIQTVHPRILTNDDIERIMQSRAVAFKELTELCSGEKQFCMSIPVQDDDTDQVFVNCFDSMERLYMEVKRMRGEIKRVLADNHDMPDEYRAKLMAIVFDATETDAG